MSGSPETAQERPARGWLWSGVLLPFLFTRATLLLLAWCSRGIHSGSWAPARRDWAYVPVWFLDVWGRWDTGWYLRIALQGYDPGPLTGENKIAFYPLYPKLIAAIHALLPSGVQGAAAAAIVGTILSNLFAVGALILLFEHVRARFGDEGLARRTVTCLLAFPAAFYLSCVYTEALFLFLAVACYHLAWRGRWPAAGAAGFLLALTRPTGVLMAPALAVLRFGEGGRGRRRRDALWILLVPAAWLGWAAYCWRLTGDPLAAVHVQAYWSRGLAWPWDTLLRPAVPTWVNGIDRTIMLAGAGLGLALFRWPPSASYGLFTLLCLASFAFSGELNSASRLTLAAFPLFILLAHLGRRAAFERAYLFAAVSFQALFMIAWTRMYWVQ